MSDRFFLLPPVRFSRSSISRKLIKLHTQTANMAAAINRKAPCRLPAASNRSTIKPTASVNPAPEASEIISLEAEYRPRLPGSTKELPHL